MQTFLITVILLLMIALIIHLLRKQQHRIMRESADRSTPLQPMDFHYQPDSDTRKQSADTETSGNWAEEIRALREQGCFEQSLNLCSTQYPKIQAYQQSLVTLRAMIRADLADKKDPTSKLLQLYRNAAMADLFRSQNPFRDELKSVNTPALALHAMEAFELPYSQIGYRHLKLLTKTDIRQFRQTWGEPEQHQHTDSFLGERWPELISRQAQ